MLDKDKYLGTNFHHPVTWSGFPLPARDYTTIYGLFKIHTESRIDLKVTLDKRGKSWDNQ